MRVRQELLLVGEKLGCGGETAPFSSPLVEHIYTYKDYLLRFDLPPPDECCSPPWLGAEGLLEPPPDECDPPEVPPPEGRVTIGCLMSSGGRDGA